VLRWNDWQYRCFYAPDDGGGGGGGGNGGSGDSAPDSDQGGGGDDGGTPAPTYETWYAALEEAPKTLLDAHVAGLKTALTSEREQRKGLAGQLRDATIKLEEGSEARKALEAMTAKLDVAEERLQFFEEGARPEIGCTDSALAYLAAKAGEFFDRKGSAKWNELKQAHPALFAKPPMPKGNAGAGAGQTGAPARSMNDFIRAASGRATGKTA